MYKTPSRTNANYHTIVQLGFGLKLPEVPLIVNNDIMGKNKRTHGGQLEVAELARNTFQIKMAELLWSLAQLHAPKVTQLVINQSQLKQPKVASMVNSHAVRNSYAKYV
jgi:hypothetical protein